MNATAMIQDGRRDFDFLHGEWRVHHRVLQRRGAACDNWLQFEGSSRNRALMGGLCNVEEADMPARDSQGVSFRTFDVARRSWSIYWVSSADGLMSEPVHGRFENGESRFYGVHLDDGRPAKVVFLWTDITAGGAQWSQAFSYDEGRTWETNWVMDFERTGA